MPSCEHEGLIELFRQCPEFTAALLHDTFSVRVPAYRQARLDCADLPELLPTEFRADAVVTFTDGDETDQPVLSVVVEVQLGPDKRKKWSWPAYLANLRARTQCPVVLLVVCTDTNTADQCAIPIQMGHPGWELVPLVFGPRQVPLITEPDGVAPELAVLSAVTHDTHPQQPQILRTVAATLEAIDPERAIRYSEVMFAVLGAAARNRWEALMITQTFKFQSAYANRLRDEGRTEGIAEGKAEGKAEGAARAVIRMLDARGIAVPASIRERISQCVDLDQLDIWVSRAATATTAHDLFD